MITVTESVEAPEDTARAMRSRRQFLRRNALAAVVAPAVPVRPAADRPTNSPTTGTESGSGPSAPPPPVLLHTQAKRGGFQVTTVPIVERPTV